MKILVCISKSPDTTSKIAFTDSSTKFDENGVYMSSVYQLNPVGIKSSTAEIVIYSNENTFLSINNIKLNIGISEISSYNKDGTLAETILYSNDSDKTKDIGICSAYKNNSIFYITKKKVI